MVKPSFVVGSTDTLGAFKGPTVLGSKQESVFSETKSALKSPTMKGDNLE